MLKHLLTLASLCICGPLLAQDAKPRTQMLRQSDAFLRRAFGM